MLEYYTDAVSSYASSIDNVFILIFWMTAVWFVLAEGIFFGFCFAFRKKEGKKAMYLTGEEDHSKKWIFCHTLPSWFVMSSLSFSQCAYG